MKSEFTPIEKNIIIEELEDIKDHYEALIEADAFDDGIDKEEAINRVNNIEQILSKV